MLCRSPEQHADTSGEDDDPEDHVDPAPPVDAQPEGVVRHRGVELPLHDPGEPYEEAPQTRDDHQDPGEHGAHHGRSAGPAVIDWLLVAGRPVRTALVARRAGRGGCPGGPVRPGSARCPALSFLCSGHAAAPSHRPRDRCPAARPAAAFPSPPAPASTRTVWCYTHATVGMALGETDRKSTRLNSSHF